MGLRKETALGFAVELCPCRYLSSVHELAAVVAIAATDIALADIGAVGTVVVDSIAAVGVVGIAALAGELISVERDGLPTTAHTTQ